MFVNKMLLCVSSWIWIAPPFLWQKQVKEAVGRVKCSAVMILRLILMQGFSLIIGLDLHCQLVGLELLPLTVKVFPLVCCQTSCLDNWFHLCHFEAPSIWFCSFPGCFTPWGSFHFLWIILNFSWLFHLFFSEKFWVWICLSRLFLGSRHFLL